MMVLRVSSSLTNANGSKVERKRDTHMHTQKTDSEMTTYKIVRRSFNGALNRTVASGLSLSTAQAWCRDPETSSRTCTGRKGLALTEKFGMWFDGYTEE